MRYAANKLEGATYKPFGICPPHKIVVKSAAVCDAPVTAQHHNKEINPKATAWFPANMDLKRAWVSCSTLLGSRQNRWTGEEEHSLRASGLSNHSHHMPPGGVREQGGKGGAPAPKYRAIPQHLSRGGSLTTATNQHTHRHPSPVSWDHRNSICPALISTRPCSWTPQDPSSSSPLPPGGTTSQTAVRPLMSKC